VDQRVPDYGFLKNRSCWLAFGWRVGQLGQVLGAIGTIAAPTLWLSWRWVRFWLGHEPAEPMEFWPALLSVAGLVAGAVVLMISSVCLKAYVRKRGGSCDSFGEQSE
jgi:hypothetical protein